MTIDVARLLDDNRLTPRIVGWYVLLTAVLIMDGFDLVALGLLAPSIAREFGLPPVTIGWILTGNHLGVAMGGLLGGLVGDAIGRKKAIAISITLFGTGTMICALVSAPIPFVCARFIAGIGMGAATPNIGAWLVETLPGKWTSRLTTFAFSASTGGSTLCAIAASFLLPISGWRSVFALGGIAPLLLLPLLVLLLPESPRYLIRKMRPRATIAAALNHIGGTDRFTGEDRFVLSEVTVQKSSFMQVFSRPFLRDTIALWGGAFTIMFASVGLISVATLLLTAAGMDQQSAVGILVIYNLAGLAGALCAFLAVHWFGSRLTMGVLLAGGLTGLTLLGLHGGMGDSAAIIATTTLMALVAFCLNSVLLMVFPLGAQLYPTDFRASGSGAAFGFGRIGSTISPVILASILAGFGPHAVYYCLAVVIAFAFALILTLRRHIRASAKAR